MCMFILLVPFMAKNFNISPDITIFIWLFGSSVGIWFFSPNVSIESLSNQWLPVIVLLAIGLTIGAYANLALGRVVLEAPNPALPFAIVNAASAVVYLLSAILAVLAAKWFGVVEITLRGCIGITIVLVGLYLVSTGNRPVIDA